MLLDSLYIHFNAASGLLYLSAVTQVAPDKLQEVLPHLDSLTTLNEHVNFLQSANSELTSSYRVLNQSFSAFTSTINIILGITVAAFTAIAGLAGFFGFQTIKASVDSLVQREVKKELSQRLDERLEYLERIAGREGLLDQAVISYYLPDHDATRLPEFSALSKRFKRVKYASKIKEALSESDIIVLDVDNSSIPVPERKKEVADIAIKAKSWVVLVIYTSDNRSPLVSHLRSDSLPKAEKIEHAAANTKVTLIGQVENSVYVSDAIRNS